MSSQKRPKRSAKGFAIYKEKACGIFSTQVTARLHSAAFAGASLENTVVAKGSSYRRMLL
jgi:hypothetical protein